jgi:replication fork protection complex subunit Tof1/Swi1
VPKEILPAYLDEKIETIERFIREPLDTHGRELNALVMCVRKPRAGGEPDDVLNPADLPDGWNGNQSDSEEDGDYFDRARATGSLISGDHAAADGGLLRTSGGKKRGKASKRGAGGSRKPKRRTQQDFINDSDDEFAFALADLQDEATQRERAASDSHASDAESDNADRETPPTSSMADEQADEGKVNALQALRAAKQRVKATSKPSEPLQDASERTNRRVDTKRLFLADSDEDEDDILALSSQEQASFLRGSPRPAADDSSNGIIKKRRLAIVDDEDSDDD